jgi:hypothetical protein
MKAYGKRERGPLWKSKTENEAPSKKRQLQALPLSVARNKRQTRRVCPLHFAQLNRPPSLPV